MKIHIKAILFFTIIVLAVSFTGCREITTTTRIFPDGSCERTIVVPGDSTVVDSVFAGPFPMPVDSTWKITYKMDSTFRTVDVGKGKKKERKDNKRILAQKQFQNVSALNRLYGTKRKDSLQVKVDVCLNKKFRWFNTFYQYTETIRPIVLFRNVPIKNFMTPEELSLYYIKEDTLHLDKKVDQWLWKAAFEDVFEALVYASETFPDKILTPEAIHASKDSLFAAFKRADLGDNLESKKLAIFLSKFYGNNAVNMWRPQLDEVAKSIIRKQEFLMALDTESYVNEIIMPGLIFDTNASTVEGNKAVWKFDGKRLFWENYVLRVESRVANPWAIWVTAGLFLAALAVLTVSFIRRK